MSFVVKNGQYHGQIIMADTVIVGGGVIGASIAYYLTKKGITNITIVERHDIACHASGKAGGFLARGWGDRRTSPLHKLSFDLIKDLSTTFNLQSYRTITTLEVSTQKGTNVASWLDGKSVSSNLMDSDTAQITPGELTHALINAACSAGAKVQIATVDGLEFQANRVTAVKLDDGNVIPCSRCIIAMGVWSTLLGDWIGKPNSFPITGIRSSSVIFPSGLDKLAKEEPYALFCGEDEFGCHLEVYPRPNGEIYVCGCGGSDHVKGSRLRKGGDSERPENVPADLSRTKIAVSSLSKVTSFVSADREFVSQACMRPCPPDSLPFIGSVPGYENLLIAAGHNCWGILWSAGTGLLVSELVAGESPSINLSPYNPGRYM